MSRLGRLVAAAAISAALSLVSGCPGTNSCPADSGIAVGSDGGGDAGSSDASVGGAVGGLVDRHCFTSVGPVVVTPVNGDSYSVQPTNQADCAPDAGVPDGNFTGCAYGATVFNQQADDDACKYHLSWSSTPLVRNEGVWFTLSVISRTDLSPISGGTITAEVFVQSSPNTPCLGTHVAPNSGQATIETFPGTYLIGPIVFDVAGQWTVRFHVDPNCVGLQGDSPHGHAAFYVAVP